jgi:hypothetical protein
MVAAAAGPLVDDVILVVPHQPGLDRGLLPLFRRIQRLGQPVPDLSQPAAAAGVQRTA